MHLCIAFLLLLGIPDTYRKILMMNCEEIDICSLPPFPPFFTFLNFSAFFCIAISEVPICIFPPPTFMCYCSDPFRDPAQINSFDAVLKKKFPTSWVPINFGHFGHDWLGPAFIVEDGEVLNCAESEVASRKIALRGE